MKLLSRKNITLIITIALISLCVIVFDIEKALAVVANTPLTSIAYAFAFLVVNLLFSCVRYHVLLRDLHIRQPFFVSLRTNIISILSGIVFFNFFGQSLSRAAMLSREQWSPAMAFLVTSIERIVSLLLLIIMACIAAVWLFGNMHIALDTKGLPVAQGIYLCVVVLLVLWLGLKQYDRVSLHRILGNNIRIIVRTSVITFSMHAMMLLAYVVLAKALAPSMSYADLFALSAIVMLAASLPISFSGWGVRELSAAYAFTMVGQSSEAGLAMGLMVGILSLLVLAVIAVLSLFLLRNKKAVFPQITEIGANFTKNFLLTMGWALPVMAAVFVLFQIQLPTSGGKINVNLADPIAISGAIILLLLVVRTEKWRMLWSVRGLGFALTLSTAALLLGFLHSWVNHDVIPWALYNRFFGWFVLLAYLLTGALITAMIGRGGLLSLSRIYMVACAALVIAEIGIRNWGPLFGLDFLHWQYKSFYGAAGNPNAFSYQLVLAVAIGLSGKHFWSGRYGHLIQSVIVGILFTGLWYSQSRASLLALLAILLLLFIYRRLKLRQMGLVLVTSFSIILVTSIANYLMVSPEISFEILLPDRYSGAQDITDIQADRVLSIVKGLELWREYPLFGAGLGVFMHDQVVTTGKELVIHNSYLWLLAELGIVGFLVFMLLPASVLWTIWQNREKDIKWYVLAVLGFLLVMAVTSLVHDMLYQRAFWLLMGAFLAYPRYFTVAQRAASQDAVKAKFQHAESCQDRNPCVSRYTDLGSQDPGGN